MNALPVIVRELRAEARNPATFSTRLAGAAILLGLLAFLWGTTPSDPRLGTVLFGGLHSALNLAIWLLVPWLSADCISRERRENTLGLLFLTPLSPFDIVVAKGLVHGWRALMLWLAVLPVLAVPLLMGGVSGVAVLTSVLVNFSALCWALAAGLLASAFSRTRSQALALAGLFTLSGFLLQGWVTGLILYGHLIGDYGWSWTDAMLRGLSLSLSLNVLAVMGWSYFQGIPAAGGGGSMALELLLAFSKVAVLSVLALVVALFIAARTIRLNWQEKPPGPRYFWFLRVFCEPFIWRAFFKLWIRRKLERNPIGWLEQRNWTGRTAVAVWLAIVVSFYIAMLGDTSYYGRFNTEVQFALGLILAVAMASVSAGSFRRERDLGVMELLLVTPLRERELALGRLKGIWEQFIPALVLLLGLWLWISLSFGNGSDWVLILFWGTTFASLPVTGLYQSLKRRGTLGALIWTLWPTLLMPLGLAVLVQGWSQVWSAQIGLENTRVLTWLLPIAWQAGHAAWNWRRLQHTLVQRAFPMEVQ
jgi:ABC-type transport system involved in multi-copper enzyme maturation permease subunit